MLDSSDFNVISSVNDVIVPLSIPVLISKKLSILDSSPYSPNCTLVAISISPFLSFSPSNCLKSKSLIWLIFILPSVIFLILLSNNFVLLLDTHLFSKKVCSVAFPLTYSNKPVRSSVVNVFP